MGGCCWRLWLHLLLSLLITAQISSSLSSSNSSSPSSKQLCHSDESSALLQFKNSFSIYFSTDSSVMPPSSNSINSWSKDEDCCAWSGITCERRTGYVIGVELDFGGLQGTLYSDSSLFSLGHLKVLDLSLNDFRGSSISPKFGGFVNMTHLHLAFSNFSGRIPSEISHLSKLITLKLSSGAIALNPFERIYISLTLDSLTMKRIAQNLTSLQVLSLSFVDMSSVAPISFINLSSSLTTLELNFCNLHGKFPETLFHLPNLEELDLRKNTNLTGSTPTSNWSSSPLHTLVLSRTKISIDLLFLTSNLKSMSILFLRNCNFVGSHLEISGNLTQLMFLDLAENNFGGHIPWSQLNLEGLISLDLSFNKFVGELPEIHSSSTNTSSSLHDSSKNQLVGSVPMNLSMLHLSSNSLNGTIPSWVYMLPSLEYLTLKDNQFTGNIKTFQSLSLSILDLSSNKFHGTIPSSNLIKGRLPIPPHSTIFFSMSNNQLTGGLSSYICNLTSVKVIDLSNNYLSGKIPPCMGSFSQSLSVLDLQMNQFQGKIPSTFPKGNSLRNLNLHGNQLEGPLPQSLINCEKMEVLDLGDNKLNNTFPNWLESLPSLHVLILRFNRLYGPISDPITKMPFQNLRIMDLSNNQFGGRLPTKYFENLMAMKNTQDDGLKYMGEYYYEDNVVVVMKGNWVHLVKIQTMFITIDFSNNFFRGEIPRVIGELKSLKGLNLSFNKLTGEIPSTLGNLSNLEWLDISSNMLVGEIPKELAQVTSLAKLNLSRNQLVGPIPRGKQFDTFENDSYSGNSGLCGDPLTKSCSNNSYNPPTPSALDGDEDLNAFDWQVVWMGYGCGMVIGLSVGYIFFSINAKADWRVRVMGIKLRSKTVRWWRKRSLTSVTVFSI